jgi:hypothetical protein
MPRESAAAASVCGEGVLSVVVALQTRRVMLNRCVGVEADDDKEESSAALALLATTAGKQVDRGKAAADAVAPQRDIKRELLSGMVERKRRERREKQKKCLTFSWKARLAFSPSFFLSFAPLSFKYVD